MEYTAQSSLMPAADSSSAARLPKLQWKRTFRKGDGVQQPPSPSRLQVSASAVGRSMSSRRESVSPTRAFRIPVRHDGPSGSCVAVKGTHITVSTISRDTLQQVVPKVRNVLEYTF